MKYTTFIASAMMALALPTYAHAVTVAVGSTQVGDTGGINAVGVTSTSSFNRDFFSGSTTPSSDWVWSGDINSVDIAVYEFEFDLTGFDLTTASISGLWGVDNTGTISLNGNQIATLNDFVIGNFANLTSYGTSTDTFFNAGLNTLRFDLNDLGGQAAFRATGTVTADVSAVPLPASALLLLGGLGGVAGLNRRKKRAA
ncbi:MAG: VPLPA-CTERM sorting domain-containing protein [Litoreibacter sp.]